MNNCDKVKAALNDYIEGKTSPELKSEIEDHLAEDPECKKIFDQAVTLKKLMNDLPAVSPSENFDANLRTKIIELNNKSHKQPVFSKKNISLAISGSVLVAAMYFFTFTDLGNQQNVNNSIMPSSTISNNVSNNSAVNTSQSNNLDTEQKMAENDSLNRLPEKIDESRLKLAGDKEKK